MVNVTFSQENGFQIQMLHIIQVHLVGQFMNIKIASNMEDLMEDSCNGDGSLMDVNFQFSILLSFLIL